MKRHLTLVSPDKDAKRATSKSVAFISKGYAHDEADYMFRREQSKASRELNWERTEKMPTPYLTIIGWCLAVLVGLGAFAWIV